MTLAETQRRFAGWLGGGPEDATMLVDERSRRGLAVYAHAYRATLIACLRDTFEKTHAWLGDDGFDAAARAHIVAHPPSSWTLADYGAGFDETLAALHPDDPETAELAWLDWSLRRAFDGPDVTSLDPASLAGIDWDAALIRLVPTLALRPIVTNAPAIWSVIADGKRPPPVRTLDVPAALLVWREGLSPRFRTIDQAEYAGLSRVLAGAAFAMVCEAIADADRGTPPEQRAGEILAQWFGDELIAAIES